MPNKRRSLILLAGVMVVFSLSFPVAAQEDAGAATDAAAVTDLPPAADQALAATAAAADATPLDMMVFQPWDLDAGNGEQSEESLRYQGIIFDLVLNEVRAAGYRVILGEDWSVYRSVHPGEDILSTIPQTEATARDADVSLSSYFRIDGERVFLMIMAYDVRGGRILAGDVDIARSGLVLVNNFADLMGRILPQIAAASDDIRFMKENPGSRIGTAAATVVFFSPNEGAVLSMPGIGEVGVIRDGRAELPYQPLALGQQLEIVKERDGYYSDTESFVLKSAYNEIRLTGLYPETRMATEFSYNFWYLLGMSAAFRYYLIPDQMFIRLNNQFFFDPPPASAPPGGRTLIHDDILLEWGNYLIFGADSRFRISYAAGLGMTFTPLTADTLAVDSYLNIAGVHLEYNLPGFTIFLRQELRYAVPIFTYHVFPPGTDIGNEMLPTTVGVMIKW